MRSLEATAPDPARFAPFGALIEQPRQVGDRRVFSQWLAPVDGLAQKVHLNKVAPTALPSVLTRLERHPHAAQMFLPVDVERYLVTAMPSAADGAPDPAGAVCMLLPGSTGVVYRPGVWHASMTVLDRTASFAVLMWRGAPDDDVFADIAPLSLGLADLVRRGTGT